MSATTAIAPNTSTTTTNLVTSSTLSTLTADFRAGPGANVDEYVLYSKGKTLLGGRYSFISNLQTGSFGKVSAAFDSVSGQRVAIKALKKSVNGVAAMAQHEMKIMNQLGYHRNITQLLDYLESRKYCILVLEYADQGDLYDAIHNKTPLGLALQTNYSAFANFLSQILNVLSYSHSRGVYHRDIKPENILLTSDGTIKLCDWGLSTTNLIASDYNVGTEKYMAPEALIKGNYNCQQLDAYSLGITLLFTLFNRCPFRKATMEDNNYNSFIHSKHFIYDFFPNISSLSFDGIIEGLLIKRDLDGSIQKMIDNAHLGFTLDQQQQHEEDHHHLSFDELFLYDEPHREEINATHDLLHEDLDVSTVANNSNTNSINIQSSNLKPISIPTTYHSNQLPSASIGSSYVPHSASLFDKNIWDSNSFMNSFELTNNDWKI